MQKTLALFALGCSIAVIGGCFGPQSTPGTTTGEVVTGTQTIETGTTIVPITGQTEITLTSGALTTGEQDALASDIINQIDAMVQDELTGGTGQ